MAVDYDEKEDLMDRLLALGIERSSLVSTNFTARSHKI